MKHFLAEQAPRSPKFAVPSEVQPFFPCVSLQNFTLCPCISSLLVFRPFLLFLFQYPQRSLRLLCKRALFGFDSYPIKLMHKTPKKRLPFSLSAVSTIFFSDNEIYEVIPFQFPSCCFLFYEENSPLWIQKISSLNDCEANKQLSEDAGGRLKLTQKARNLARNSCIGSITSRCSGK